MLIKVYGQCSVTVSGAKDIFLKSLKILVAIVSTSTSFMMIYLNGHDDKSKYKLISLGRWFEYPLYHQITYFQELVSFGTLVLLKM